MMGNYAMDAAKKAKIEIQPGAETWRMSRLFLRIRQGRGWGIPSGRDSLWRRLGSTEIVAQVRAAMGRVRRPHL